METYRLAVIEGDGIGREVVPEGLAAIRAAAEVTGSFAIETVDYPWSCEYYATHGRMMDDDALDRIARQRRHLPGRHRLPGRPRSRVAVEHAAAAPPGVRPVGQPAARCGCCRGSRVRCATGRPTRSTWSSCARTPRASTAASAAGIRAGTPDEVVTQTGDLHPQGHRAHRPLRVRPRHGARPDAHLRAPSRTRSTTRWSSGTRSSPTSRATTPR